MLSSTNRLRAAIQCATVFSIAVSASPHAGAQNLYVTNYFANNVIEYSSTGYIHRHNCGGMSSPIGNRY